MIKTEIYVLDDVEYTLIQSDEFWLERDDGKLLYADLTLPNTHAYTETTQKIIEGVIDENKEALKILFGEA